MPYFKVVNYCLRSDELHGKGRNLKPFYNKVFPNATASKHAATCWFLDLVYIRAALPATVHVWHGQHIASRKVDNMLDSPAGLEHRQQPQQPAASPPLHHDMNSQHISRLYYPAAKQELMRVSPATSVLSVLRSQHKQCVA